MLEVSITFLTTVCIISFSVLPVMVNPAVILSQSLVSPLWVEKFSPLRIEKLKGNEVDVPDDKVGKILFTDAFSGHSQLAWERHQSSKSRISSANACRSKRFVISAMDQANNAARAFSTSFLGPIWCVELVYSPSDFTGTTVGSNSMCICAVLNRLHVTFSV